MADKKCDVIVVGAGPVGLCSALCLADNGVRVTIVEEQWKSASRSYALALHTHSLRLFQKLGIARHLTSQGNPIRSLAIYDHGEKRFDLNLQEVSGELRLVLALPQQLLEEALIAKLKEKRVDILWNHRAVAMDSSEGGNQVFIERLSKESTGYSVTRTEWVVEKAFELSADFVIAADGHRSSIRQSLGLSFEDLGNHHSFAVFEFQSDSRSKDGLQVALSEETVNVLWPLADGRFRWSFEIPETEQVDPRIKSRLLVQLREKTFPYVTEEKLKELISQRAPWFQPSITNLVWSAAIRFERRLASAFGKGRISLVGDAAHTALPMGIQSMNAGFREAELLSSAISDLLRSGGSVTELNRTQDQLRTEWIHLLEKAEQVEKDPTIDGWIRDHSHHVVPCIPASGDDLEQLIKQFRA